MMIKHLTKHDEISINACDFFVFYAKYQHIL